MPYHFPLLHLVLVTYHFSEYVSQLKYWIVLVVDSSVDGDELVEIEDWFYHFQFQEKIIIIEHWIIVSDSKVGPSDSVESINVTLDSTLGYEKMIKPTVQHSWYHMHQICKNRIFLSNEQAKSAINAYITYCLDQNNIRLPKKCLSHHHMVQNTAVWLIVGLTKRGHNYFYPHRCALAPCRNESSLRSFSWSIHQFTAKHLNTFKCFLFAMFHPAHCNLPLRRSYEYQTVTN